MALTSTQQRNAVSEGAALGLVLSGRPVIPYNKMNVDLSFTGAWRDWEYADRFSQVSTDLRKGLDGVHALTRASESRRTGVLYWDNSGRELTIHARMDDWDPNDEADVEFALNAIDGGVPLDGWVALAKDFLTRLDR